jgi:uncharacterized surface protein with fasciclin (FAS1) repeats
MAENETAATAVAAGAFTSLVAAVAAARPEDALKGTDPFTGFAPCDEAFSGLSAGTVEHLVKPENKAEFTKIRTLHIKPSAVVGKNVARNKLSLASLGGRAMHTDGTHGVTFVGSTVLQADIFCSNWVLCVIDTIMLPAA